MDRFGSAKVGLCNMAKEGRTDMGMYEKDHVEFHMEYWRGVREEAAETLARICYCTIPETNAEVAELLACVFESGGSAVCAQAVMAASAWVHADNEVTYKKRQEEQKKGEVTHDHA